MAKDQLITRRLAEAQEHYTAANTPGTKAVIYRLYTEDKPNLPELVSRYFDGATIYSARGLWQGASEPAACIEIIGIAFDLQSIVYLAGDIKHINGQSSVLVTWAPVERLDV